jgi:hypothetical protein
MTRTPCSSLEQAVDDDWLDDIAGSLADYLDAGTAPLDSTEEEAVWQALRGRVDALLAHRRRPLVCADCGCSAGPMSGHYYSAAEEVWTAAGGTPGTGLLLCLDCFEVRLDRPLSEADFVALPHEIMARFAGGDGEPKTAGERQAELDSWREYIKGNPPP